MPDFMAALMSALWGAASSIAGRVMIAIGVHYVTYQGFDAVLGQIVSQVQTGTSGLPSQVAAYVGFFRIPEAISIISGAISAKWTLMGMASGAITRMIIK